MSGRRYDESSCRMGWSITSDHVIFDDNVIVSFRFNGHRSREEAAQALEKMKDDNKGSAIRVQVGVIIQI